MPSSCYCNIFRFSYYKILFQVYYFHRNMLNKFIMKLKNRFSISVKDKICFFGSGTVAYPSALKLIQKYDNITFVTHYTPQKTKLTNQIEILCKEKNIQLVTPIKSKVKQQRKTEWKQFVASIGNPDFGIVCSFGYMLPKSLIRCFNKGMIVVHPSLLPKYRGGAPIFHAIANGQEKTGVSYIEISEGKFDSGRILRQKQWDLPRHQMYDKIQKDLAKFASQHLLQVLENIDQLRPGKSQDEIILPQEQLYKLHAPIVKQKYLDFNKPAFSVYNYARAIQNPRIKFNSKQFIVQFEDKYLQDTDNSYDVGSLKIKGKWLFVKCKDKFLKLSQWKEPSKKYTPMGMFIAQYLRGKQENQYPKFE